MTLLDQFGSVFRSADKAVYKHEPLAMKRVLVFTDLPSDPSQRWLGQVRAFLGGLPALAEAEWRLVPGEECDTIGELLARVADLDPHLVVTFRNLHSSAWRWPHSLSDHLEVLTQVTDAPVLLMPRPDRDGDWADPKTACKDVLTLTDHLSGDARLIRHSVAFCSAGGTLHLTHIEDDAVYERYMRAIGRIPEIDTELARKVILGQLLKEPTDYIASVAKELVARRVDAIVQAQVTSGHRLAEYRRLIEAHAVDLVVMNTKDEDQLAMHGLSYPLAVEVRDVPMLLL
jgi:hypothetical protein